MTGKELREKRAKVAATIRELAERVNSATPPRDFTAEEKTAWDQAKADIDGLTRQIEIAEYAGGLEADQCSPVGDPQIGKPDVDLKPPAGSTPERQRFDPASEETRALAVQAWFRSHTSRNLPLNHDHEEACRALRFNPKSEELAISLGDTIRFKRMQHAWRDGPSHSAERRALSAVTVSTGAAITYPETMAAQLEINLLAYGGVLAAAEIMRTDTAERIRWPTVDDTANKGRRLGENAVVTSTAQPSFAEVFWDAYKYTSDEILVPYELLENTPFNLPAVLGDMMGERIGRKQADDFTTGTGVNEPAGIVVKATTKAAASATAIAWDDLHNLTQSVDPAYRIGAGFMFHDSIRNEIRKLKDGQGRPLWADTPNSMEPPTLLGYPWYVNQSMDSTIAAAKKTVLFGRLTNYKVRQVRTVRFYRLVERHRENDQDAFLAFMMADGNLLNAGTAPIKVLLH